MKTLLAILAVLCFLLSAQGQPSPILDSLQREYAKPKELKDRVKLLESLASATMNVNLQQADKYGEELIELAEKAQDAELLTRAYLANGARYADLAGQENYTEKATHFFKEAQALAQKNKLKKYQVLALLKQTNLQLAIQNTTLANQYLDEATTLAPNKGDSTTAVIALIRGDVQLARNRKTDALRSYLFALRLADSISNTVLQRQGLVKMATFYSSIEDYDKAIDYYKRAIQKLDELPAIYRAAYTKVRDTKSIGDLYTAKKNYSLAKSYYEASIRLADSLQYPPLKMHGYSGLLNVYVLMKEPRKSLAFMNSEDGSRLKAYLQNLNMAAIADQVYAVIYSEMGELDSAGKYFDKSAAFFNNSGNPEYKMRNSIQTAFYQKRKGNYQQAINLLLQAGDIAKATGQLEYAIEINKNLDTLYSNIGDYKQSKLYSAAYYQGKDSLQTLNKEKELSQIEADDALQQVQREQQLLEEKEKERNNIQYIAITVGIATVFFLLVLLGMFRVSARTIKIVGFFAFIMFFEFIFLVSKTGFHHISHGVPWMDLLFLVGLAAILVPLHHAIEHKVLHYLTAQNKLTSTGDKLKARFGGKAGIASPDKPVHESK